MIFCHNGSSSHKYPCNATCTPVTSRNWRVTTVMLDAMSLRLVLRRVPARDGVGLVALAVAALDGESVGGLALRMAHKK